MKKKQTKQKKAKQSWSTSYTLDVEPFVEEPFAWENSAEGELSILTMHIVDEQLEPVDVDAHQRLLIWPDGQRLSLIQSAQRIHVEEPELPVKIIEEQIIAWLDMSFAPESYTRKQLAELDRLTERWIKDHYREHPPD